MGTRSVAGNSLGRVLGGQETATQRWRDWGGGGGAKGGNPGGQERVE